MTEIVVEPLSQESFAPFGQVIVADDTANHYPINAGMTERFHDLARIELGGVHPRPLLSIFRGKPYRLPLQLQMVERHPLGSQAFFPLSPRAFLAIVAPDESGVPGTPRAFLVPPRHGVNIAMNTWHGVLTPLGEGEAEFLVVDRGGDGSNLEEFFFSEPYLIVDGT